jgi:hypothetical protein
MSLVLEQATVRDSTGAVVELTPTDTEPESLATDESVIEGETSDEASEGDKDA